MHDRAISAAGIVAILFLLSGCTGPSEWALQLEANLKCGMTVAEVQALAGRPVRPAAHGPRSWTTHMIDGDDRHLDDIDLGFIDGKLRYVQVYWGFPMTTRVVERPRRDLCDNHPGET